MADTNEELVRRRRGHGYHGGHHDGGWPAPPDSLEGAVRRNYPMPPSTTLEERDFRAIEEAPARKEAELMRRQGERAAGTDVPMRTTYPIRRVNPHRRVSRRTT